MIIKTKTWVMFGSISAIVLLMTYLIWPDKHDFCSNGNKDLLTGPIQGTIQEYFNKVNRECITGQTIQIPGNATAFIAQFCDFSKALYSSPSGIVVCVFKKAK